MGAPDMACGSCCQARASLVSKQEVRRRKANVPFQQNLEIGGMIAVHVSGDKRIGTLDIRAKIAGVLQGPGADEIECVVQATGHGVEQLEINLVRAGLEVEDAIATKVSLPAPPVRMSPPKPPTM
jgi:hypothetical protein